MNFRHFSKLTQPINRFNRLVFRHAGALKNFALVLAISATMTAFVIAIAEPSATPEKKSDSSKQLELTNKASTKTPSQPAEASASANSAVNSSQSTVPATSNNTVTSKKSSPTTFPTITKEQASCTQNMNSLYIAHYARVDENNQIHSQILADIEQDYQDGTYAQANGGDTAMAYVEYQNDIEDENAGFKADAIAMNDEYVAQLRAIGCTWAN